MTRREVLHSDGLPSVHMAFTDAAVGSLRVPEVGFSSSAELEQRRRRVAPHPWTWLRQVHGDRVVEVDAPGEWTGAEADAAVTTTLGAVLAVHTADCAGVVLVGDGADPVTGEPVRVIGAAHAGWRGLAAGVVEGTVEHMRRMGADRFDWDLGPCISPAAYAFGAFGVPLWQMAVGAFIGSVPRAFVYTALGASIGDLSAPLAYTAIAVWCVTAVIGAFAAHRGYRNWRAGGKRSS